MDQETPRSDGLLGSLHRLADGLLGVFQNRLELLSIDIQEGRVSLIRMVLVTLGILFCFQAAIILAVLYVVLTAAEAHRMAAVGISALVLFAAAFGATLWLWSWLKARPPFFAATIDELKKDRERLGKR